MANEQLRVPTSSREAWNTYVDCARAESYTLSGPRAGCIYSHRAAEHSREVQRLLNGR